MFENFVFPGDREDGLNTFARFFCESPTSTYFLFCVESWKECRNMRLCKMTNRRDMRNLTQFCCQELFESWNSRSTEKRELSKFHISSNKIKLITKMQNDTSKLSDSFLDKEFDAWMPKSISGFFFTKMHLHDWAKTFVCNKFYCVQLPLAARWVWSKWSFRSARKFGGSNIWRIKKNTNRISKS